MKLMDGWSGTWETHGGLLGSAPDASAWGSSRMDVFAVGGGSYLYQKTWNGSSWTGWNSMGGAINADPGAGHGVPTA